MASKRWVGGFAASAGRRATFIVGMALAVAGVALVGSVQRDPSYSSEAKVLVQPDTSASGGPSAAPVPNMATEEELAQSPQVVDRVIRRLGLSATQAELVDPAAGGPCRVGRSADPGLHLHPSRSRRCARASTSVRRRLRRHPPHGSARPGVRTAAVAPRRDRRDRATGHLDGRRGSPHRRPGPSDEPEGPGEGAGGVGLGPEGGPVAPRPRHRTWRPSSSRPQPRRLLLCRARSSSRGSGC